jgi:hypothetical protein
MRRFILVPLAAVFTLTLALEPSAMCEAIDPKAFSAVAFSAVTARMEEFIRA